MKMWSDQKCKEIAFRHNFPSSVFDINIQKSIISRFLNFYLSGKVPKGQTVEDIVFAVLSIMPFHSPEIFKEELLIWHPDHYADDGTLFFLSPEQKLQYDINMLMKDQRQKRNLINKENLDTSNSSTFGNKTYMETNDNDKLFLDDDKNIDLCIEPSGINYEVLDNKIIMKQDISLDKDQLIKNEDSDQNQQDDVKNGYRQYKDGEIRWFRLKLSVTNSTNNSQTIVQNGPLENRAFCKSCNILLDDWSNIESRLYLKYFFGNVALVLMRTRVKSFYNINNYFNHKFETLYCVHKIEYLPPHKSCIKKCWKAFRTVTLNKNVHVMYAKIVINSFHIDKFNFKNGYKINIFKMALLAHAANYGMGIISMMQEIACHTNIQLVLESLQSEETKQGISDVKKYIDKFLINNNENTHHWSRLIDIDEFRNLSCNKNYSLAVVMAAFIEMLRTDYAGIWKSTWVNGTTPNEQIDCLKKLGYTMYETFLEKKRKTEIFGF